MSTVAASWIRTSYYSVWVYVSASIMTNYTVNLFTYEIEIAAADTELHDPDRDVDEQFTSLSPDFPTDFTIRMQLRVLFRNFEL